MPICRALYYCITEPLLSTFRSLHFSTNPLVSDTHSSVVQFRKNIGANIVCKFFKLFLFHFVYFLPFLCHCIQNDIFVSFPIISFIYGFWKEPTITFKLYWQQFHHPRSLLLTFGYIRLWLFSLSLWCTRHIIDILFNCKIWRSKEACSKATSLSFLCWRGDKLAFLIPLFRFTLMVSP